jgi:trimeric autotransporter adhesin
MINYGIACSGGLLAFLLISCGGGGSQPRQNPVPAIQSISPATAAAGATGFTLTINGTNFVSTSTLTWNGLAQPVTFVSPSQLTTSVSGSELGAAGTIPVSVSNPAPGGGQAVTSFIISPPAAPAVASVSPSTVSIGGPAFTLTVAGSNFVSASVVQWNGTSEPTTYVDNAHLTAAIPASAITASSAGNLPVTVTTPAPGGGNSNSIPILVQYPLPSIASLSPAAVVIGGSAFTLTVNGSNLASGAVVYLNNLSRVTHFVNPTQLTASILSADLTGAAGNLDVTVQNPSPSAGISSAFPLVLQNPPPIVSSVTPSSILAGNPTSVTITGSGFVQGTTIQVNGQSFAVTDFVSSTSLTSLIDIPVGSSTLTVLNPSPTVGASNGISLTGTAAGNGLSLIIASVDPSGNTAATDEFGGALSSTARYFTFGSYLRDTCLGVAPGCTPSTMPYTQTTQVGNGVSTDGRYVLSETGFEAGSNNPYVITLFDTCTDVSTGCTPAMTTFPGELFTPMALYMTPSARYFSENIYNSGIITQPVYIVDTCVGAAPGCSASQTLVVNQATGGSYVFAPRLSDDGRYLAYVGLIPNSPVGNKQIQLHDSCLGAPPGCSPSDSVIASSPTASCQNASIGSDAQYVVYTCTEGLALEATCLNAPPSCSTTPTSITTSVTGRFEPPAVSAGGRFVAYPGTGPINGVPLTNPMVFVYDSCIGAASGCVQQSVPVCLNASGAVANDGCQLVSMTSDGQYILFSSSSTNLGSKIAQGTSISYIVKNPLF